MHKQIICFFVVLAVLVALGGCRAATGTVERAQPLGNAQIVEDNRVLPDKTLRGKIEIIQVNEGTVSGNLIKAQVILRNRKSSTLTVNYAWEWYDSDGMQVSSVSSAYKSLRLAGDEQAAVSTIAPNPQAVDFVLKLQEPRPFLKRHDLNPFNP